MLNILHTGKERESLSQRALWRLISCQMAYSHCASAEYMAMLMAILMVFNRRMMLNSGMDDLQTGHGDRR